MGLLKTQVIVIGGGETFNTYDQYIEFLKNDMKFDPMKYGKRKPNWKENLGKDLGRKYETIYLSMPNKLNAKYKEWEIYFHKVEPHLRHGVVLVGHSLGGAFLLKYLSKNRIGCELGDIFLVSTPLTLYGWNEEGFADFQLSAGDEWRTTSNFHTFQSTDDTIVTSDKSAAILIGEDVIYHTFENRGHFIHDEHFPELVHSIKHSVLDKKRKQR